MKNGDVELDTTKDTLIPSLDDNHYFLFNASFNPLSCGDAMKFIIQRNFMTHNIPKQLKFLINSPGGQVNSCFALIDTIKGSRIPVHTFGLGLIASCGLLTFISGVKGKRFITPNTAILSHQFSSWSIGKEHELYANMKEFEQVSRRIIDHYRKCTGLPEKRIKEVLLPPEDVWLDAKEAVKYGIADKIVEWY